MAGQARRCPPENLGVHVSCALEIKLSISLSILLMRSGINTVSVKRWLAGWAGKALTPAPCTLNLEP